LGDIQVNEDGSKTMNNKNQKIIHRWDYGRAKPTWTTQSSKNISKVLDHLKLGLVLKFECCSNCCNKF
jgi:hypothetical protein